jgi:aspartate kinase
LKKTDVVIVPGFIAKDGRGRFVTLGRGGSDISAFLLSELLMVKELTLLKDANGIFDLDPSLYSGVKKVSHLAADELGLAASSGAQVLNPVSLKHHRHLKKLNVQSVQSVLDKKKGTQIELKKGMKVVASPCIFSVLTFIGDHIPETPGLLNKISSALARNAISIYSVTVSDNLISLYIARDKSEHAYRFLSPLVRRNKNLKLLNLKKNIGKVLVRSMSFINEPGIIKYIVTPISKAGINIWEILTAHTDVMIFVESKDLKKTHQILRRLFKRTK